MNLGKFIKSTHGAVFNVDIYENYVIKRPRERPKKPKISVEQMEEIAAIQTKLSEHIKNVLPAWVDNGAMYMPTAPGILVKDLPQEQRLKIDKRKESILKEIRKFGYELKDFNAKNMFYEEETDMIYAIDFHLCKKIKEAR